MRRVIQIFKANSVPIFKSFPRALLLFVLVISVAEISSAQRKSRGTRKAKRTQVSVASSGALKQKLGEALQLAKNSQFESAAGALFVLSRRPELASERAQIKYVLGLMLMEMKLNQVAAFQFVDAIRLGDSRYRRQAIEKLSIVADTLGDDTLLNYSISKVDINTFPPQNRDMVYFRLGEARMKAGDFKGAVDNFSRVPLGSSYFNQAVFNRGLAELESNDPETAARSFRGLISARARAPVTDTNKVAGQLAYARALYQKQDWDAAIEAYAAVPRDHVLWHDALFEQSWAMLRGARFRSALSNFQSLHSSYYEDFYIPESLLLRAIVYLYICKYDEMNKVLSLFERSYGPVSGRINDFIRTHSDSQKYFEEVDKAVEVKKTGEKEGANLRLPYIVLRFILGKGDVKRSLAYLRRVESEKAKIESNSELRATTVGQYSLKVLNNRIKNTKMSIGDMTKAHMLNMRLELRDLYEQAGLIRYEMINGQKETIRKKITEKDLPSNQIDDKIDRRFYVDNGYEYYPFRGEYWLDEIGNYHYLGRQSCQ